VVAGPHESPVLRAAHDRRGSLRPAT
jgi:hypothetical protein